MVGVTISYLNLIFEGLLWSTSTIFRYSSTSAMYSASEALVFFGHPSKYLSRDPGKTFSVVSCFAPILIQSLPFKKLGIPSKQALGLQFLTVIDAYFGFRITYKQKFA